MVKDFLSELRSFCETTSLRGIPRICKARTRSVLVVWVAAVVVGASLLTWTLAYLIIRYFQFPVNTVLVQGPSWQRPTFPDITVCNLSPLVYQNEFPIPYIDYANKMQAFLEQWISSDNVSYDEVGVLSLQLADLEEEFAIFLLSPTTYLNRYSLEGSFSFDENDTLILKCSYFDWLGKVYDTDCMATMQAAWDPIYYKCFTLRLNDSDRANVRGFSAVMYVDEFLDNQFVEFDVELRNSRATGARVLMHAPGTAPDMSLGMSISSGMETSVVLSQTTRTRLDYPYSNCTDQQHLKGDDSSAAYTVDYCVNTCLQQQFITECECLSNGLQYTMAQLRQVNFTVCGNSSQADLLDSYVCMTELGLYLDTDACYATCFDSCNTYNYEAIPSSAAWPQPSTLVAFYDTFIRNVPRFGSKFSAFQLADDNVLASNASSYLQLLVNRGMIQNNFLQLNVQFGSPRFAVQQDMAAFTMDAVGGQIGGALSLWLGVTVMFLFEVFEFLLNFLSSPSKEENLIAPSSTEESKM